jgi:hypothetical protein
MFWGGFSVGRTVVAKHFVKFFRSGESDEQMVCAYFKHTAFNGKKYGTPV